MQDALGILRQQLERLSAAQPEDQAEWVLFQPLTEVLVTISICERLDRIADVLDRLLDSIDGRLLELVEEARRQ